jgi:hypothetical protein
MEHKKFFRGERPDWAKTFPERKIRQDEISVQQKRFSFQVNFNTVMPWCHWVEREVLLSSHPNQEVLIERLNDAASICRRVTIISTSLDGQGGYARIEDKKDRGSWKVTLWESSLSKLEHRSCEELLNFPGLLSDYVVQWVAQS